MRTHARTHTHAHTRTHKNKKNIHTLTHARHIQVCLHSRTHITYRHAHGGTHTRFQSRPPVYCLMYLAIKDCTRRTRTQVHVHPLQFTPHVATSHAQHEVSCCRVRTCTHTRTHECTNAYPKSRPPVYGLKCLAVNVSRADLSIACMRGISHTPRASIRSFTDMPRKMAWECIDLMCTCKKRGRHAR